MTDHGLFVEFFFWITDDASRRGEGVSVKGGGQRRHTNADSKPATPTPLTSSRLVLTIYEIRLIKNVRETGSQTLRGLLCAPCIAGGKGWPGGGRYHRVTASAARDISDINL